MKITSIIGLFFLAMTSFHCLDTIEVDLPDATEGRLVIDGVVERSPDLYRFLISVSRTKSLEEPVFTLEENVEISVLLNDTPILDIANGRSEIYSISEFHELYGEISSSDLFNIRVQTDDGSIFESEEQTILESPLGGSISFELEEKTELNDLENPVNRNYVKMKVNTPVVNAAGERLSMSWNAYGVYAFVEGDCTTDPYGSPRKCYITEAFGENIPRILEGGKVNGDAIEGFEVVEATASPQFAIGFFLTLIRRTLNPEAGSYWNEVRQSQQREGTIFDPPAGIVRSNIQQVEGSPVEVLGYFYTAGIDTLRQFGSREIGGSIRLPCASNPSAYGCCDCLELPTSTYDKPAYWE